MGAEIPADVHYAVVPARSCGPTSGSSGCSLAGGGAVFAGYGRASDVTAWLSGERYAEARVGGAGAASPCRLRRRRPWWPA